jgi:RP/EB family microtubule-associated protein
MATAAAVTEGRGELLSWVNDLLQLSVSKIESIGTGSVLCQIMDSIFGKLTRPFLKLND